MGIQRCFVHLMRRRHHDWTIGCRLVVVQTLIVDCYAKKTSQSKSLIIRTMFFNGAAEDVSLAGGHFHPYLTRPGGARAAYAESSGDLYSAKRAIEKPDGLPGPQPTLRLGSSCWCLWLLSGIDVCS